MSGIDSARFNNNSLQGSLREINAQLRWKFDRNDPIFHGLRFGGIGKRNGGRGKRTPSWTRSDAEIRELLLRSFPKLLTDPRQHEAAARWALLIYMYWRRGLTHGQIVVELNRGEENSPKFWNLNKVRSLIHRIRRAADPDHQHRGHPRS